MKKIIISTFIGLVVSFLIFIPFWLKALKVYSASIESHNRFCQQLNVCSECNFDYECLKNKCLELEDRCLRIEENYAKFFEKSGEIDKQIFFVNSLCGNGQQKVADCWDFTNTATLLFKTSTIRLALYYVSLFFGVGYLFLLSNFTWFIGVLILSIPVILGFFIGIILKLRQNFSKFRFTK